LAPQILAPADLTFQSFDNTSAAEIFSLDPLATVTTTAPDNLSALFDFSDLGVDSSLDLATSQADPGLLMPTVSLSSFENPLPPLSLPLDNQPPFEPLPMQREPSRTSDGSSAGSSTNSTRASPNSTNSPAMHKFKVSKLGTSAPKEDSSVRRRQLNNLAAKRYRQKRLDRISELEEALDGMTADRDDLRLQLARKETEVEMLRELARGKS